MKIEIEINEESIKEKVAEEFAKKLIEGQSFRMFRQSEMEKRADELISQGKIDKEITKQIKEAVERFDASNVLKDILKDKLTDDDY